MKKCLFTLFFIILSLESLSSQNDYLNTWNDETLTDSIRARAYYNYLFVEYMFDMPDSALILVDKLKVFAEGNNDLYAIGLSEFMRAQSYYYSGDNVEALKNSKQALETFKKHGNQLKISQALSFIGEIYSEQGDNVNALDFIKRSTKIAEEINNTIQRIHTLNLIGDIYFSQEDNGNALNYYSQSLELTKNDTLSLDHANALFNLGNVFTRKRDYNKSLYYYNESEPIYRELGEQVGLSNILYAKGNVYTLQKKYNIALEFYKESLAVDEEYEIYYNAMLRYLAIGQLYNSTGNFIDARRNCLKSLEIAEEYGAVSVEKDNCDCLYKANEELGNTAEAFKYLKKYRYFEESLKEEETAINLLQMEFSKQVEADSLKQVEIDLRKQMAYQADLNKKDRNKNIAIGAGLLFLLLAGGSYSRYRYTKKSKNIIEIEKERSENLLLNILPEEIAEELKEKGKAEARDYQTVSVLFTDFKGFTEVSEQMTAKELIAEINSCFQAFDQICMDYDIEKVKTIGDAYMAAGGLPIPSNESVKNTILAAIEMQTFIGKRIVEKKANNQLFFEMRLGIHTGPLVAGIVGIKKFQYDIWGDTVNTAARMESSGEVGKVNISEDTYNLIKEDKDFLFEYRGKVKAKGKGEIDMYFVKKA